MTKKKQRETRLWQFDPSVFQPGPKASMLERFILRNARSIGKHGLYALAFAYPIILVTLGVVFGGLVFWTSLVGSASAVEPRLCVDNRGADALASGRERAPG